MEHARHWNQLLFQDLPDPRTKVLPLMGNPVQLTLITATWLWFVLKAGPRFMSDRKPFALASLIQAINVVQVLANAFVAYEFLSAGWLNGYALLCEPCDRSHSPDAMRMARACYIYVLLKLLDMVDTVIYVLRRKDNQISFLHLYHHLTTLLLAWIGTNYIPGGQGTLLALTNSFVHVIMYSYYFLAALGPQYQRYLWWKKYLTLVQMVQFVFLFTLSVMSMRVEGCDFPRPLMYMFLPFIVIMFALFANFYVQSYRKRDSSLQSESKEHQR